MSIAALVVTYNRLDCLMKCISALKSQSRVPDEIIIINNGSTDGTFEFLSTCYGVSTKNQLNLGGAGGFSAGIALAFEGGHSCVWCMDDDCLPFRTALETLEETYIEIGEKYPVLNSSVIKSNCAPGLDLQTDVKSKVRFGGASLFNGTLISIRAFKEIGNVNADLILWGDEINFAMRCTRRYGAIPVAVHSHVAHPPPVPLEKAAKWKKYFMVRNSVYNSFRFSRFGYFGLLWVLYLRCGEMFQGKLEIGVFLHGVSAGLRGHLGWTNPYLSEKN